MSEHMQAKSPHIEQALEDLFAAPNPEPAFVASLERQLLAQAQSVPRQAAPPRTRPFWSGWPGVLWRQRGIAVAAGLVLILALTVAAVGPARVVAAIQDLVGYVPGIGFVDLEETRVLAAPVEVRREKVTLHVEQVIARPERTEVVIRSEGLPPEEQLWPGGASDEGDYEPILRLRDGRMMTTGTWTLRLGGGTLEFPPLPEGVHHVTLELARLPLVPAGSAPENWRVPLDLRPATGELVTELFPEPYVTGAQDIKQGITLRVVEVAHTPEETAICLQIQWAEQDWRWLGLGHLRAPELRDNLGHVYHETMASSAGSLVQTEVIAIPEGQDSAPTPSPGVSTEERILAFAPLSPSAGQLTLWMDGIQFEVPATAGFTVDLGSNPQVGERWPLDVHLTVAGFPVHIRGAQLVQEELMLRDGAVQRTVLQFDVDTVPDQNGRTLHGIGLVGDMDSFEGGSWGYNYQTGIIRTGLHLRDGAEMPDGPIDIRVEYGSVAFHGPWELTWTLRAP